jgi:hypothetical protein
MHHAMLHPCGAAHATLKALSVQLAPVQYALGIRIMFMHHVCVLCVSVSVSVSVSVRARVCVNMLLMKSRVSWEGEFT